MAAKVRLAMLAAAAGRNVDAHNLLKESLKADESNVTLRSVYTHFLISIGSYKEALTFTTQTLRVEKNDPYTFCALGWLHFTLGREAKSPQELAERPKQYLRSAEAYERALVLDPKCAMAAQGLAIALAEDALSMPGGNANSADEGKTRIRLAGQALSILSRINDSIPDGSVNVNMGHCYFIRGEEEKAIQAVSCQALIPDQTENRIRKLMRAVRGSVEYLQGPKCVGIVVPRKSVVCVCEYRVELLRHV